ncbi:MAG: hypothetical protein AAFU85_04035 [Planctomycetota bacterium]
MITLIALVALDAGGFAGIRIWLDRRPLEWRPFSANELVDHPDDRPIVVFVHANWDPNSIYLRQITFVNRDLVTVFNRRSVRTYLLDITNRPSPEQKAFLGSIDQNTSPVTVVFPRVSIRNRLSCRTSCLQR